MQPEKNVFHNIIMESRKKLSITGVKDIESFNEECVIATTVIGVLTVKGNALHIGMLNIDSGDMNIDGHIDTITYSDSVSKKSGSVFKKLFK